MSDTGGVASSDEWLSIGAVAERAGIATSSLRYYEREGLITAERAPSGQRRYRRDVLRRVAFIRSAQHVGLSLAEIGEALGSLPQRRNPTADEWAQLATRWRPRIDAEIARLEQLRDQLDACIGCGCLSLSACALYNPADGARKLGAGARYLLGDRAGDVVVEGTISDR